MSNFETSVLYGGTTINYGVIFSARKTLGIQVYPDGKVIVRAPNKTDVKVIYNRVKQKSAWIIKQQNTFKSNLVLSTKKTYLSGENHYYLGQSYPLTIRDALKEKISLSERQFKIETRKPDDADHIKKRLRMWYRREAERIFTERYNDCIQSAFKIGIEHDLGINVRVMSRRWGSCSKRGKIILSLNLIATPIVCIDHVILHELCHLKEFNHSAKFYQLLRTLEPDWKQKSTQLDMMGNVYCV